jgi:hypothetical protein
MLLVVGVSLKLARASGNHVEIIELWELTRCTGTVNALLIRLSFLPSSYRTVVEMIDELLSSTEAKWRPDGWDPSMYAN